MNTEELRNLANDALPCPLFPRDRNDVQEIWCSFVSENSDLCLSETARKYIAAANPAAVLELIAEIERVTKQRDELLEALKDAREMVSDWAGYASPYFQEKHDIDGDLKKLDDAIAKAEG